MTAASKLKPNRGFIVREKGSGGGKDVLLPNGKIVVAIDRDVFERADRSAMKAARHMRKEA